jgi:hypothetical protein
MTWEKGVLHTDLAKLDAHVIEPEEYEDIPELTDEWFDKAEFSIGDTVIRPARLAQQPMDPRVEPAGDGRNL